ncbi:M1 family metallopeptidase [Nocardioides aquiterrae]
MRQRHGVLLCGVGTAVLFVAGVVAALGLSPAAVASPYDGGLSTPQEDSYYPEHGDPGIDVLHYGLDLAWNRRKEILSGTADITLRATADDTAFQLDLGRTMDVRRVEVDGVPVPAMHRNAVLRVEHPVVADQRYDVTVQYRGKPRPVKAPTSRSDEPTVGMSVTKDGQLRTMQEPFGAFTWFPSNDQPSDKALFDLTIAAPRDWVGVSNGRLVSTSRTATKTVTRFHLAHPVATYLTTLAVGPYVHKKATGPHGLPLNYWLPRGTAAPYLKMLRHVPADLRWLESKLGPYPFESAGVVVVPGDSAMETQTLVTFGRKTWNNPRQDPREVMLHELAHQWYGDTVTPSDWRDLWLNEGMAMYLEAKWTVDHGMATWRAWLRYFRYYNKVARAQDGGPGNYDKDTFAQACPYYCTALMYDTLSRKIGERRFWKLVRQWPQSRLDTNVDRAGFIALAEKISHKNLDPFFKDWLNSRTWPPR